MLAYERMKPAKRPRNCYYWRQHCSVLKCIQYLVLSLCCVIANCHSDVMEIFIRIATRIGGGQLGTRAYFGTARWHGSGNGAVVSYRSGPMQLLTLLLWVLLSAATSEQKNGARHCEGFLRPENGPQATEIANRDSTIYIRQGQSNATGTRRQRKERQQMKKKSRSFS